MVLATLGFVARPPELRGVQVRHAISETRGPQYALRGALAGGVLLGLAGAALGSGLCDAADCSGAGSDGLFVGIFVGMVYGGVTGLVAGTALRAPDVPAPPEPAEGLWAGRLALGAGKPLAGEAPAWYMHASAQATRPTVAGIHFGVGVHYLGKTHIDRQTSIETTYGTFTDNEHTTHHLFGWLATGRYDAEAGPRSTLFLTVSTGVYPYVEHQTVDRSGDIPQGDLAGRVVDRRTWVPLPGLALGAGIARGKMEASSRLHAILGAADQGILPVFQLSAGLRVR